MYIFTYVSSCMYICTYVNMHIFKCLYSCYCLLVCNFSIIHFFYLLSFHFYSWYICAYLFTDTFVVYIVFGHACFAFAFSVVTILLRSHLFRFGFSTYSCPPAGACPLDAPPTSLLAAFGGPHYKHANALSIVYPDPSYFRLSDGNSITVLSAPSVSLRTPTPTAPRQPLVFSNKTSCCAA